MCCRVTTAGWRGRHAFETRKNIGLFRQDQHPQNCLLYYFIDSGILIVLKITIRDTTITMSSDGLNPTGPAQPSLDQVYETEGNPASKEPAEQAQAQRNARDNTQQT